MLGTQLEVRSKHGGLSCCIEVALGLEWIEISLSLVEKS